MPKINLRLTDGEHAVLVDAAVQNHRSLQKEILARLFGSVPLFPGPVSERDAEAVMEALELHPPRVQPEPAREVTLTAGVPGSPARREPDAGESRPRPAPAVSVAEEVVLAPSSVEVPSRRAKVASGAAKKGFCAHRRPLGSFCKRCGEVVA